ncbi:hypothetical protein M2155_000595 [Streptomyces sp. SAI-119]|uniref:hypothetical protein n=1 Tax=Streptomyces sp. SAI-119 TaxID=2940541 RepID=UPI002474F16F|nr:hypothetical protein [Streptomyces sp. SAI-119]MDH6448187.1 hypothetical protein [Streptomyces sp. SAI-119]
MAYSSRRLTRLVQDAHTGQVVDLEKQVADTAVGDSDSQFAQLIARALDAWARTFGGADQPGILGEGLRRILDAARSVVLRLLDALAPRAANAAERALGGALELGVRQGDEFLHAASGLRNSTSTPRISAALREDARRIGDLVSQHRDRALFLLHPARVNRWTHLLAGLGAARSAVSTVRAHISWVINTAVNEGLDAAIRAAAPLRLWVAEADACVRCLAYTGRTAPVGESFPGGLSWDPHQRKVRTASVDGPPLHPHCRCRTVPWSDAWTTSGTPFPLALRLEAHRSLAYGRARPSESRTARLRAARELLRVEHDLLPSVEARARTAVRTGRFTVAA